MDRDENDIIKLKDEVTKYNFMGAINEAIGSPMRPQSSGSNGFAASPDGRSSPEGVGDGVEAFKRIEEARKSLVSHGSAHQDAIDRIATELWKIREEVVDLANKSNESM